MLAQRRRRWANIEPTLSQRILFARVCWDVPYRPSGCSPFSLPLQCVSLVGAANWFWVPLSPPIRLRPDPVPL